MFMSTEDDDFVIPRLFNQYDKYHWFEDRTRKKYKKTKLN